MTGDTAGGLSAEPVPLLTATRIIGLNHFQEWTITQIARGQFGLNLKSSIDGVHWKDSEQSGPFGSWQEAVRSDSTLTFVRSGQSVVFDISHSELELAQMLTCDPADKFVSWPTGNVGRIGEFQIFFLARPDIGSPAAILGDEYGELLGDVIADYLWSDNFGPSSVPEGGLLTEFAPGSAVLTPTSYNGQDGKLVYIHLTEDPSIRATGVVKWLEYMGIQAESAAKLEVEILGVS